MIHALRTCTTQDNRRHLLNALHHVCLRVQSCVLHHACSVGNQHVKLTTVCSVRPCSPCTLFSRFADADASKAVVQRVRQDVPSVGTACAIGGFGLEALEKRRQRCSAKGQQTPPPKTDAPPAPHGSASSYTGTDALTAARSTYTRPGHTARAYPANNAVLAHRLRSMLAKCGRVLMHPGPHQKPPIPTAYANGLRVRLATRLQIHAAARLRLDPRLKIHATIHPWRV